MRITEHTNAKEFYLLTDKNETIEELEREYLVLVVLFTYWLMTGDKEGMQQPKCTKLYLWIEYVCTALYFHSLNKAQFYHYVFSLSLAIAITQSSYYCKHCLKLSYTYFHLVQCITVFVLKTQTDRYTWNDRRAF